MISFVFTVFTFQIHCKDTTEKCLVISAGEKKNATTIQLSQSILEHIHAISITQTLAICNP